MSDGGRALAISLGSILLLERVERAITGGFIQIFGIYHAASGSTRFHAIAPLLSALRIVFTLALYALACVSTLRAIRRAGEA